MKNFSLSTKALIGAAACTLALSGCSEGDGGDVKSASQATSPTTAMTDQSETAADSAPTTQGPGAMVLQAAAEIKDSSGQTVGQAQLVQQPKSVIVAVSMAGLTPGMHGTHIHTTGTCTAPDFTSAGGHWNPSEKKHGLKNPEGHHSGDMPNLDASAQGTGTLKFKIDGARLSGGDNPMLDADGAAIVIHAGPDDMMTDPSGASGGRVACGIITPA